MQSCIFIDKYLLSIVIGSITAPVSVLTNKELKIISEHTVLRTKVKKTLTS